MTARGEMRDSLLCKAVEAFPLCPACWWHSMASVAVAETHSSSRGTVGTREQVPSPKLDERKDLSQGC